MERTTETRRPLWTRPAGLASAVGGATLVPYALTKGSVTTTIRAEGWAIAGLSPVATANLFHVAETIPVLCLVVGLLSLDHRVGPGGWLAPLGKATAVGGFAATIITHFGEHLLPPLTVPALTGGENWFMWGYYLSWLAVYGGLALYGVALTRADDRPRWIPALLMAGLPAALVVALTVGALDLFTFAGTFRVLQGFTWVAIGSWLWRGPRDAVPISDRATADS